MSGTADGVLAVLGDLVEDVVVWPRGPVRTGTDNAAAVHRTRGGSAANVAMFAAPLLPTRFLGRVGADALGAELVERLRGAGVDVRVQRDGRTGSIVVLVHEDGERTMFVDRGASADLGPVPADWLRGARWLHVPAYVFAAEPAGSHALALLAAAARAGLAVSLDASSAAFLAEFGPARYRELVTRTGPAVLFANEVEAELLGMAAWLPPAGTTFVIKRGAEPAVVVRESGQRVSVPVTGRRPRDSTGAGDAFAAGYLAAVLAGHDAPAAAAAGHRLAARVLDAPGADFALEVS